MTSNSAPRHHGRLELTWTDKDKTLLSTGDGRYDYTFVDPSDYRVSEVRLLHEVGRVEAPTPEERPEGLPRPTEDNLLISGDAMHVLDALAKIPAYAEKYLGKVKLVYIDPPFNTGQAFTSYEDNIEHSIWLTMLRDRLRQVKPLLSPDGSIWVHLDDVEVHRCRVIMDEEFGSDNFVAEVAWQKADSSRNDAKGLSIDHDVILVYRRSAAWVPNRMPRTAASNARFSAPDGDLNPWFDDNPTAPGAATHQGMVYAIQHPITGDLIYPARGRCWWTEQAQIFSEMCQYADYELRDIRDESRRAEVCGVNATEVRRGVKAIMLAKSVEVSAEAARARLAMGTWPKIVLRSGGIGGLGRKSYVPKVGLVAGTWWSNDLVGHNREAKAEIKNLFPGINPFATPKPERLLQRIIQIATSPGDIVIDCYAGSGTTAAVAHKMGRRWVTSELQSDTVVRYTLPRLTKVANGQDSGGATVTTERVSAITDNGNGNLPDGMTPGEAQEFNRLLSKVVKVAGPEIDDTTIRTLKAATKTKNVTTVNWHGGGSFTYLQVGESMFVEMEGMILLADWATRGALAEAMCAQLSVPYKPEGIFAAKQGRVCYVVIDGMVGEGTVAAILDRLAEGEAVEVWATQIEDGAAEALKAARRGSRLELIPDKVLDNYRRKSARKSPFGAGHLVPVPVAEVVDDGQAAASVG